MVYKLRISQLFGNSGQKTGQNQGLKTRQCDEWACLSDIGD